MTDEHDDLQRQLDEAFERRASSMSVHPPTIDELVGRSQQHSRRLLAGATLTVLAIGTVGFVALAGAGDDSPAQDALPQPMDDALPTTTIVALGEVGATWQCTGPLGTSDDGAVAYFESCAPSGDATPILATTTVVPSPTDLPDCFASRAADATTTTNPDPCVVNDTTIPTPSTTNLPETTIVDGDAGPGCTTTGCSWQQYEVQPGDYPLRVAELACVTVETLVEANGWTGPEEFPFPGMVIRLPLAAGACLPGGAVTTTMATVPVTTIER